MEAFFLGSAEGINVEKFNDFEGYILFLHLMCGTYKYINKTSFVYHHHLFNYRCGDPPTPPSLSLCCCPYSLSHRHFSSPLNIIKTKHRWSSLASFAPQ